jgi:hypothetical protein
LHERIGISETADDDEPRVDDRRRVAAAVADTG